ncbi:hypothetical protein [Bradyrhizobium paxllaeri]|uniref:hypothetical protein n=1 Tax=Bradyrhizobium paxllaeri TaxID=190148 RepID=UPI001FEB1752|nr:hypothetical protein [Bradyrhizobium paxllaeri]
MAKSGKKDPNSSDIPAKLAGIELTTPEAAALCGISRQRLETFVKEGAVTRKAPNSYALGELVPQVMARLRADRRSSSQSQADNRVRQARAAQIELATAMKARELIPLTDAAAAIDAICGVVRTEAAGIAPRCTRDVGLRRTIETEVNDSLTRIARRQRQIGHALRQGRDLVDAVASNDSGPMGNAEPDLSGMGRPAGTA